MAFTTHSSCNSRTRLRHGVHGGGYLSGESGDTDSPEGLRPSAKLIFPERANSLLFVPRTPRDKQKVISLCALCLRGESKEIFILLNNGSTA